MTQKNARVTNFCPRKVIANDDDAGRLHVLSACDSNLGAASIIKYLITFEVVGDEFYRPKLGWDVLNEIPLNFLGDIKAAKNLGFCATGSQYLVWNQTDQKTVTLMGVDANSTGTAGPQFFDTKSKEVCGIEMRCVPGLNIVVMVGN